MLLAFQSLKNWLYSRKKATDIAEPLQELPLEIQEKIRNTLSEIGLPNAIIENLKNSLEKAIANWLDGSQACNYLVVLTSPVEPVDRFLSSALENWENQHNLPLNWLSLPPISDPEKRKGQLAAELNKIEDSSKSQLAIVSDLSNGFLRCIGGLDGIDLLMDKIQKTPQSFWLIGCNTWAWEYFNKTNQIQAALENVWHFSGLKSAEIREWLKPVSKLLFEEQEKEKKYFKKLAQLSLGQTAVAKELWFFSLGLKKHRGDRLSFPQVQTKGGTLPQFSQINLNYCYLLYSLLLHKKTSLPCLAVSLGENKNAVRELLKQGENFGFIKKNEEFFEVNPLYYPQLNFELKRNNFLVAKDDYGKDTKHLPPVFFSNK